MKLFASLFTLICASIFAMPAVHAHVPYIENEDYSAEHPFVVTDSIENSKAVYAWFETGTDVDVYAFEVSEPVTVYANALVIACPSLETLLPWFAVAGPGLPVPDEALPLQDVKALHEKDLVEGYGETILPNALDVKYRAASKEWAWQYLFPAPDISTDKRTGITRRLHIHETIVQRTVKEAARRAGIDKRVTPHTLRHYVECWIMVSV